MSGCSSSDFYAVQSLAEHLHGVPRVDAQFSSVNQTFAPDNGDYVESLGFWAVVLSLIGVLLVLLVCVLCKVRACRFQSSRNGVDKADVKKSKVAVGVVLLLITVGDCALVYGCVESNLVLNEVTDSLQEGDETLSYLNRQVVDTKTVLRIEVKTHLYELSHVVQTSGDAGQKQSVDEALGMVCKVDNELEDVTITVESAKLSSALDTGKSVKTIWLYTSVSAVLWVAAIICLGFISLVCFPLCYLKFAMVLANLTILVAFAAAGISFALSLGMSDFCVNPNENTVTYLSDLDSVAGVSQRVIRESTNISASMGQISSAPHWPSNLQPTASAIRNEISSTGDTVNSTSILVTDFNGTDYGSNLNVTSNGTLMATNQYGSLDKTQAVYCPRSSFVLQRSTVVSSTPVAGGTSILTPTTVKPVTKETTEDAVTPIPTQCATITIGESATTNTTTKSDSTVAYYVYCSKHCPNPFEKDFTVAKNELNRLTNKLQELLSVYGSQALISDASKGVSSVKTSLLKLEENIQCAHLHKLYTNARDGVCNKGITSLVTIACSCVLVGILCLPLFLCLRWTAARKRSYDKSYPLAGEPVTSAIFQNEAAPTDDRSSPPPYSSVIQSDFEQGNLYANGHGRANVDGVWVNRGADGLACDQGVEEIEMSRFQIEVDDAH